MKVINAEESLLGFQMSHDEFISSKIMLQALIACILVYAITPIGVAYTIFSIIIYAKRNKVNEYIKYLLTFMITPIVIIGSLGLLAAFS